MLPRHALFNPRFGAQFFDVRAAFLLHQLLHDLRFDLFDLGQLRVAHIVHADDVEAELRLDGSLAGFAFAQGDQGVGKFLDVGRGAGPIEFAALGAGAGVFG